MNIQQTLPTLLIDLDDTLVNDSLAVQRGLETLLRAFPGHRLANQPDKASAEWKALIHKHWQRYEAGEISFDEQRKARLIEFFSTSLSDSEIDTIVELYKEAYFDGLELMAGAEVFLSKHTHIQKVIVTNGERQQQLFKMALVGIAHHFIAVITPKDAGEPKPGRKIFEMAAQAANSSLAQCVVIGDDPVRDIQAARHLGLNCFHVTEENPISNFNLSEMNSIHA